MSDILARTMLKIAFFLRVLFLKNFLKRIKLFH